MTKASSTASLGRDLTQGSVKKQIIRFGCPLLIGNLISSLYSIVDSVVVGNFIGSDAIAAIGSCYPLTMVIHGLLGGLALGSSVLVGQFIGARQSEDVSKTVNTANVLGTFLGLALTLLALFIGCPVLVLLKTPDNIMPDALSYMQIVFAELLGRCTIS